MLRMLLSALWAWLQRNIAKPTPEPKLVLPQSTKRMSFDAMAALLAAQAPDANVYLSDKSYLLCNENDIAWMLANDQSNRVAYIAEKYDCPGITPGLGYVMGLFFTDGSCTMRKSNKYGGASWYICNSNREYLEKCIKPLEETWDNLEFKIVSYASEVEGTSTNYGLRNKTIYRLVPICKERHNDGTRGKFVAEWHRMFYFETYKKLPAGIIDAENPTKKAFLEGIIDGDGSDVGNNAYCITVRGMIGTAGLIKLGLDVNWKVSLYRDKRHEDIFTLRYNTSTEDLTHYSGCDDFSYRLMGEFSVPGWSDLAFGIVWTNLHALNCFIDESGNFWFVEPQTDTLQSALLPWQGSKIRLIVM